MRRSYTHLAVQERALIETQLKLGMSPAAIAAGLMRAPSTVTREIRRNGWLAPAELSRLGRTRIAGGYRCVAADRRARLLAAKPRVARKLILGNPLWIVVVDHLRHGLSPAQIGSTLARMPDPVQLSYETIYTALYTMPRGHLRSSLLALMRRRHRARRPHRRQDGRSKPSIPEMTLIDQRSVEIRMRLIPGHWEGDLIIGKGNLSQVGTLVERTTPFVALVKLTSSKADVTAQAFTEILNRFDSQLRRSMTFDQGSEMRHHKTLTANTGVDVYFAHPHAPWERGISENTNGLLRQYLPKGTDLSLFSQDQLDDIAWRLNTQPRKTLGWKAPAELFLPEDAFDFVQHWSPKINHVALVP
ncbi:IS30 family transposase [Acidicapsa acidisoli]|uniref:IS30 family transposase n=1 Tax=Acidicapsa acidisoli TaxID=1615681 RepID=UPI0021DFEBCF|nr:IS30 family transposase [Acidicapsa acidisoli]